LYWFHIKKGNRRLTANNYLEPIFNKIGSLRSLLLLEELIYLSG
jgi:hypothetical protein